MRSPSPTLTRRLLVEAGLARTRPKLSLDLIKGDAADVQHDQKVVEHIGSLSDRALAVLGYGGDGRLHRLFAELLGALRHAAIDQLARVGHVRTRLRTFANTLFQVMEGERRHAVFLSIIRKNFPNHSSRAAPCAR